MNDPDREQNQMGVFSGSFFGPSFGQKMTTSSKVIPSGTFTMSSTNPLFKGSYEKLAGVPHT